MHHHILRRETQSWSQHTHLTKHPVDRAATRGICIQREISPSPQQTFTRAEMRALRKRPLLGLAVERRSGRDRRPRSPPRVCLPVVRSRGEVRRDRRLAVAVSSATGTPTLSDSIINCEIRGRPMRFTISAALSTIVARCNYRCTPQIAGYTRGTAEFPRKRTFEKYLKIPRLICV